MTSFRPFLLERYFAKHEFNAKYIACASDGESLSVKAILSMNNHDAESRKMVNDLWNNLRLGYTESEGSSLLREEICKMYNNEYYEAERLDAIKKENVLIITPQEGIYFVFKCLLQPNDHIIALFPSYQSLYENAIANNINCSFWKFRLNKDKNWYLDIDELENKLIKPNKTIMIVLNFPHNPTGYVPSKSEFVRILNIAKKHKIMIFSDEMYWFLFDEDITSAVMMSNDANIISLSGMSKTFCAAGLRIGWLMTRNVEFIERFQRFKDYVTICSSAPSEVLSILALRNGNYLKVIKRIKQIIQTNKIALYEFVNTNEDIFYWTQYDSDKHSGGLTKFIGYKLTKRLSVQSFCDCVVRECGVMLLPSTMYQYFDDEFIRFGLGRKNLKEALNVLNAYLMELRKNNFQPLLPGKL